jgi:hypothetical protein
MNIAFAGPFQSGKSTAAKYAEQGYGISRVAFGDYVREELIENGWDRADVYHKPSSDEVREALQSHGAGMRAVDSHYWVDKFLLDYANVADDVCVDDMRYTNEAEALRDMGFKLVWVDCQNMPNADDPKRGHESENGLNDWYEYDGLLVADYGHPEELYSQLDELIARWSG